MSNEQERVPLGPLPDSLLPTPGYRDPTFDCTTQGNKALCALIKEGTHYTCYNCGTKLGGNPNPDSLVCTYCNRPCCSSCFSSLHRKPECRLVDQHSE